VVEAELRALGLVAADFDLFRATNAVQGSSVLAFYDSDTKKIVVRGTKIDAEARVTLAHELTHALQDQHYDLDRIDRQAKTSGAQDAELALVEGDATRIEDKYYQGLSAKDQRIVDDAEGSGNANATPASPDVATQAESDGIVGAELDAPYALGPQMVDAILSADHRPGLAAAFRRPPRTQLDFLLPSEALNHRELTALARPTLAGGANRLVADEPDDFGAADLYFLISSRVPAAVALQAADAWSNGKRLVSRAPDGPVCVDIALSAQTKSGEQRMMSALEQWAAALPSVQLSSHPAGPQIHACDLASGAVAPPNTAEAALSVAAARASLVGEMLSGGAPGPVASCIGDRILDRPEFAVVAAHPDDEPSKAEIESVTNAIGDLIPSCG
jgi:hypothetical protein